MKGLIALLTVVLCLTSCGRAKQENSRHVVLPNPGLLRCSSPRCSQLWDEKSVGPNAVYPRQVMVDVFNDGNCPGGMMALYDPSVSMAELQAAVDERYGKWAFGIRKGQNGEVALGQHTDGPLKLWRVEPEKFVIQLAPTDEDLEESDAQTKAIRMMVEKLSAPPSRKVTGRLIYLTFDLDSKNCR